MTDIKALIEQDRNERAREVIFSGALQSKVAGTKIPVTYCDNGTVKFIRLGESQTCVYYIQDTMIQQLVNEIYQAFKIKAQ